MPIIRPPIKRYHLIIRDNLTITKLGINPDAAASGLPKNLLDEWKSNGKKYKATEWGMRVF
jgi:hypothetical protein